MISQETSNRITALRFPLIFGIILVHSISILNNFASKNIITDILFNFLRGIVPVFIFISSYLFFLKKDNYITMLKKKTKRLIIPYVLWIIILCLIFKRKDIYRIFQYDSVSNILRDILELFTINSRITLFPAIDHFWFIRNLIILFLISPILIFFIKQFTIQYMLFVTFLYILIIPYISPILTYNTIHFFFYFSLGAVLGFYNIDFYILLDRFINQSFIFIVIAALFLNIFSIFNNFNYENITFNLYIFLYFLIIIHLSKKLSTKQKVFNILKYLSSYSYFVFIIHLNILKYIILSTKDFVPKSNSFFNFMYYFTYSIITAVFCLTIAIVLKRFTPKLYGILNGSH